MKKTAIFLAVVASVVVISLISLLLNTQTNGAVRDYALQKLKSNVSLMISDGMYDELSRAMTESLISINEINGTKIMIINTSAVNDITLRLTRKANEILSREDSLNISIPLGNLTGIALLSGLGTPVVIRAMPIGNAVSSVESELVSGGINQTNHRIWLTVHASASLLFPLDSCLCDISVRILISETIIAGEVPNVIWRSGNNA